MVLIQQKLQQAGQNGTLANNPILALLANNPLLSNIPRQIQQQQTSLLAPQLPNKGQKLLPTLAPKYPGSVVMKAEERIRELNRQEYEDSQAATPGLEQEADRRKGGKKRKKKGGEEDLQAVKKPKGKPRGKMFSSAYQPANNKVSSKVEGLFGSGSLSSSSSSASSSAPTASNTQNNANTNTKAVAECTHQPPIRFPEQNSDDDSDEQSSRRTAEAAAAFKPKMSKVEKKKVPGRRNASTFVKGRPQDLTESQRSVQFKTGNVPWNKGKTGYKKNKGSKNGLKDDGQGETRGLNPQEELVERLVIEQLREQTLARQAATAQVQLQQQIWQAQQDLQRQTHLAHGGGQVEVDHRNGGSASPEASWQAMLQQQRIFEEGIRNYPEAEKNRLLEQQRRVVETFRVSMIQQQQEVHQRKQGSSGGGVDTSAEMQDGDGSSPSLPHLRIEQVGSTASLQPSLPSPPSKKMKKKTSSKNGSKSRSRRKKKFDSDNDDDDDDDDRSTVRVELVV